MSDNINKNNNKDVSYLGKDFSDLKENLETFIKSYYPEQYKDFSESAPGEMLIELAAYVGDVLGFHMDKNLQEFFSGVPKQRKNAMQLAQRMGYTPSPSVSSTVYTDIYLVVPATGTAGDRVPDEDYLPVIKAGTKLRSDTNPSVIFETKYDIDFNVDSGNNLENGGREVTIWEEDENGFASKFLIKKRVQCISGETQIFEQTINEPQKYLSIELPSDNISEIIEVIDADDNKWYQVDTLAQDTVFESDLNIEQNDPETYTDNAQVPYLLKLKRTPKRYTITVNGDNLTYINFGSGVEDANDEEIIPNPENVGSPILNSEDKLDYAVDPENFLKTRTYGEVPANTTLTIKYREGGGVETNVPAKSINTVVSADYVFPVNQSSLDQEKLSNVKSSIGCENQKKATGGKSEETNREIIENAFAERKSQKRCVTKEDYIVRAYSLPSKYGNISKVYIEQNQTELDVDNDELENPFSLDMYVLSYNNNGQLEQASYALKKNLRNYLSQYRMITDSVRILDGRIVNIQVNFEVVVAKDKNKNDVLSQCIQKLKEYFNIQNWNFNQPIVYSEIAQMLTNIDGVQSIPVGYDTNDNHRTGLWIENVTGNDYSNISVNIEGLTKKGIVYPPKDTSIFEVKKPNVDIKGHAIG